jgi:hypothetical protein
MADRGFARNFFFCMIFPLAGRLTPFASMIGGFLSVNIGAK